MKYGVKFYRNYPFVQLYIQLNYKKSKYLYELCVMTFHLVVDYMVLMTNGKIR